MNALAAELNDTLAGTAASRLLSRTGREMYFPRGIVAQTSEANQRAHRFNATVGMAFEGGEPVMLAPMRSQLAGMGPAESVAYAPTPGVAELRTVWMDEIRRKNPSLGSTRTTLPMVTGGLTNGLFQITELFVDSGDAIVMPDLFWGNYRLMAEVRRGAQIVEFPMFTGDGRFNAGGLDQALEGRSKAIVLLNFPNNPTGYTPTLEEAADIEAVLVRRAETCDLLVVCDDAYFGLVYEDGLLEESLFARLAGASDRILAVKVDGATKEDFAWGFRVGFVTLAGKGLTDRQLDALERKLMGIIRATVSNSSRIAQSIILKALQSAGYREEKTGKFEMLKRRYATVREIVSGGSAGPLTPLPFNSGYFMAFSCTGISAEQLRRSLLDEGIGTIAIGDEYLRVAFSTIDEQDLPDLYSAIYAAADRLAQRGTR
jgi:aspartate/methionine/tyrosine aminotransferase